MSPMIPTGESHIRVKNRQGVEAERRFVPERFESSPRPKMCRKQTINIQGLIFSAVEHVDEDCEQRMKP
jgi:hypothetical protein